METPAGTLAAPLPAPRPERLGWVRTTLVTMLACLVGGVLLMVVVLPLVALHLQSGADLLGPPSGAVGDWPLAVAAIRGAFVCWVLAWSLRRCVRDWTDGWDVRLWPAALACAAALLLAPDGVYLGFVGIVLLVIVARYAAIVPRPAPRWRPRRWERVAVALGVASAAVVALAYQPLHPLASAFDGRRSDARFGIDSGAHPHGQPGFGFMLGNEGIAGMAVRSLQPIGLGARDVEVVTDRRGTYPAGSLRGPYRPVATAQIARGATFTGSLRLTQDACRRENRHPAVEVLALEVRYETLGMTRTQRLAIAPPAQLTCR